MGAKNQFSTQLNWSTTSPIPTFLPQYGNANNSPLSGTTAGVMSSTNTIYSQIMKLDRMDNSGLEVTWTGTPTGTLQVMASVSGINFYALTFDPVLTQPAGGAGGYLINLNQFPFRYFLFEYTNQTGTGALSIYGQFKDVN